MTALFGTDGIRGQWGSPPLTEETAWRLGLALRRRFGSAPLVLIRDTRESGIAIRDAVARGMSGAVIDAGVLPTAALSVLLRDGIGVAGVAITASHNPWQDNGLKVLGPGGFKLNDAAEAEIEADILQAEGGPPGGLQLREESHQDTYMEAILGAVELRLDGVRIALDCAHGAAHHTAPALLRGLGAEVHAIGIQPNGRNINDGLGAVHPEVLAEHVLEVGADVGICLDGDADRCILVDETGAIVDGDALLLMLARPPGVVGTVMCNAALPRALSALGIGFERAGVGDRQVAARMAESAWPVGGEPSGHVLLSDGLPTGDGLLSALRVLQGGVDLRARLASWRPDPQAKINVRVRDKPPLASIEGLAEAQAQAEGAGATRILLRYSGTEPKLRVMVEAPDEALAEREAERLAELIRGVLGA